MTIAEAQQQEQEIQNDEENQQIILSIDLLQEHGIGVADIQKLKTSGLGTIRAINMTSKRSLSKVKGMSEAKIDKIKEVAQKIDEVGFMSALELSHKREIVFHIQTGSKEFDTLLGGGMESMSITEVFGEFRTGKTQICMTQCITCQLCEGGGKAAFIDTEGTFRPDRLKEIAQRYELDPDEALENVIYSRAYNTEHQMELITLLGGKFAESPGEFKLLIVDSIISLFRTDFSGRGELGERQQKLNIMLAKLARIAEEFNVVVLITNQMMSDPGATMSFVPDPKKPVGGHVLAHASTTRLSLRKGRGESRIAKIFDSPNLPEAEATYAIGPGGIEDSKD